MHHRHLGIQNSREISMPHFILLSTHTHFTFSKMYHSSTFCYQPLTIKPLPIQNSITIIIKMKECIIGTLIRDKLNSIDSVEIPFDCWDLFIEPTIERTIKNECLYYVSSSESVFIDFEYNFFFYLFDLN